MMQTTIIIPCYNEEKRLPVNAFQRFAENNKNVQFLFVNDGSNDNTIGVLKTLCSQNERLLMINLSDNCGKAEAVRQGMSHAFEHLNSTYIGFWDADLATPLNEIEIFIDCFQKNDFQIVTGCRLLRLGANVKRKNVRHYLGRIFASAASIMLGMPVYDTQCGAKLYKAPVVPLLFDKPFISQWLFDVELLARYITIFGKEKAIKNIYEYPLFSWEDVDGSSVNIKAFYKAPVELWKIKRKYL
jgi:dolichyl-phosphate beta-glucosyltransferase